MVLALLHHLLVTERAPLESVIQLLSDSAVSFLIIDWIGPADLRLQQIAKTHGDLYEHLSVAISNVY